MMTMRHNNNKNKKSARFSPGSLECVVGSGILHKKTREGGLIFKHFCSGLNASGSRSPMANAFGTESLNKMVIWTW